MRLAFVLVVAAPAFASADVLPDLPDPDCDPGYIVQHGHGGVHCVRPSCRSDDDCPTGLGLVCPPGHCFRYVEDRECLEREGLGRRDHDFGSRNAFEPPPPCPPLQVREGPEECQIASDCGAGLNCTPRTCQPGAHTMSARSAMASEMSQETEMSEMSSEMRDMSSEMSREVSSSSDEGGGCAVGGSASWLGLFLLLAVRRR